MPISASSFCVVSFGRYFFWNRGYLRAIVRRTVALTGHIRAQRLKLYILQIQARELGYFIQCGVFAGILNFSNPLGCNFLRIAIILRILETIMAILSVL